MAEVVVAQRHSLSKETIQQGLSTVSHACGDLPMGHATIFDVLSPSEETIHRQLYPRFLMTIKNGIKAQFTRATLRVDGQLILP